MDIGTFDRTPGDTGNIVALEHVNVEIPDQQLATIFYVMGLGLTRDPYLFTGIGNMSMRPRAQPDPMRRARRWSCAAPCRS